MCLEYTYMHSLVERLITRAAPNSISRNKLLNRIKTQLWASPLPNIYNTNKNLLQMLGTIKFWHHLGHTTVPLKVIVRDPLPASVTIGANFRD